jgi:hypothetical protein
MKRRIHENSIRLRLTQKEVAHLHQTGRVDAMICFAAGTTLSYSVKCLQNASEISATFNGNAIRVVIPPEVAIQWTNGDDVGIHASQAVGENLQLELLIEKDFQYLHRTVEHEPDAYPNPLAASTLRNLEHFASSRCCRRIRGVCSLLRCACGPALPFPTSSGARSAAREFGDAFRR